MGNLPDTYHLLVTLPNQPGEWVDTIVEDLEDACQTTHQCDGATVTYLVPETLPDRYVEAYKFRVSESTVRRLTETLELRNTEVRGLQRQNDRLREKLDEALRQMDLARDRAQDYKEQLTAALKDMDRTRAELAALRNRNGWETS